MLVFMLSWTLGSLIGNILGNYIFWNEATISPGIIVVLLLGIPVYYFDLTGARSRENRVRR